MTANLETAGEHWERRYGPLFGALHSRAQFYGALLRRLSYGAESTFRAESPFHTESPLRTESTIRDQVGRAVRDAYKQVSSDIDRKDRDGLAALHYSRFCHRSDIVPLEQVVIVTHMIDDVGRIRDIAVRNNARDKALYEAEIIRKQLEEHIDVAKRKVFSQLRAPFAGQAGHTPPPFGHP